MIVIADTSPIHYLVLVDQIDILPRLFQTILIQNEVLLELDNDAVPPSVRGWAKHPPAWLQVRPIDPALSPAIPELDLGEEAAIRLAQQQESATLLLMDDAKGRDVASRMGLRTTGTLGVLFAAARDGLLSLENVLPQILKLCLPRVRNPHSCGIARYRRRQPAMLPRKSAAPASANTEKFSGDLIPKLMVMASANDANSAALA